MHEVDANIAWFVVGSSCHCIASAPDSEMVPLQGERSGS